MPILHVIREGDSDAGTPSDVAILREPFTANQLLTVVGSLLG
jgi:hypothetical protein